MIDNVVTISTYGHCDVAQGLVCPVAVPPSGVAPTGDVAQWLFYPVAVSAHWLYVIQRPRCPAAVSTQWP